MSLGKETGRGTEGARRGTGPSTYTKIVEITSGRTIFQQGLAATCKDLVEERRAEPRGGIWFGA
jgi:hypothetical protein